MRKHAAEPKKPETVSANATESLEPKLLSALTELTKCFNSDHAELDLHALSNAFDQVGTNGFAQLESACAALVLNYINDQPKAHHAILAAIRNQAQRGIHDWDYGLQLLLWSIQAAIKQIPEMRINLFNQLIIPGAISLLEGFVSAQTDSSKNNEPELIPRIVYAPVVIAAKWRYCTNHSAWNEIYAYICENEATENFDVRELKHKLAYIIDHLANLTHVAEMATRTMMATVYLSQALHTGRPDIMRDRYKQAMISYLYGGCVVNPHFQTLLIEAHRRGVADASGDVKEQRAADEEVTDLLMQAASGTMDGTVSAHDEVLQDLKRLTEYYTEFCRKPSEQLLQTITTLVDTNLVIHCRAISMYGCTIYTNDAAQIAAIQSTVATLQKHIENDNEQTVDRLMVNAYLALRICNDYSLAIMNYLRLSLHPQMRTLPVVPIYSKHYKLMLNIASGTNYQFLRHSKIYTMPACLPIIAAHLTQPGENIGSRDITPIARMFPEDLFTLNTNPLLKNDRYYPSFLVILLHAYPQKLVALYEFLPTKAKPELLEKFYKALGEYFRLISSHDTSPLDQFSRATRPRAIEFIFHVFALRYGKETELKQMTFYIAADIRRMVEAGCPYTALSLVISLINDINLTENYACVPKIFGSKERIAYVEQLSIKLWHSYMTSIGQIANDKQAESAFKVREETRRLLTAANFVDANPEQQADMLTLCDELLKFKAPGELGHDRYHSLTREYGYMMFARHYQQAARQLTSVYLKVSLQKICAYKAACHRQAMEWDATDDFMVSILSTFVSQAEWTPERLSLDICALLTDPNDSTQLPAAMLYIACLYKLILRELDTKESETKSWWPMGEDKHFNAARTLFFTAFIPTVTHLWRRLERLHDARPELEQYVQHTHHELIYQRLSTASLPVINHEHFFEFQDRIWQINTIYQVNESLRNMICERRAQTYLALMATVKEPQRVIRLIHELIKNAQEMLANLRPVTALQRLPVAHDATLPASDNMPKALDDFFQNQSNAAELMHQGLAACANHEDLWDATMQFTMQMYAWLRSPLHSHGKLDRTALISKVCYPVFALLFKNLSTYNMGPQEKTKSVRSYLVDVDKPGPDIDPELPIAVEEFCLQIMLQCNAHQSTYMSPLLIRLSEYYIKHASQVNEPTRMQAAINKAILLLLHLPVAHFSAQRSQLMNVVARPEWPKEATLTKEEIRQTIALLEFLQPQQQEVTARHFIADLQTMNQVLTECNDQNTVFIIKQLQEFSQNWMQVICGYRLTGTFLFWTSAEENEEIKRQLATLAGTINQIKYTPPQRPTVPALSKADDDAFFFRPEGKPTIYATNEDPAPKVKPKSLPTVAKPKNKLSIIQDNPEQSRIQLLLVKGLASLILLSQHKQALILCVQYRAFGGTLNQTYQYLELLLKNYFQQQDPEHNQLLDFLLVIEKHGLPQISMLGAVEHAAAQFVDRLQQEYRQLRVQIDNCATNEDVYRLWGKFLHLNEPNVQGYPLIGYLNMMFNPFSIDFGFTIAMKASLQPIWDDLKRYEFPPTELLPESRSSFNWQGALSFVSSLTSSRPSPAKLAAATNILATPSTPYVERVTAKPAAAPGPTPSASIFPAILPGNRGQWLSMMWAPNPTPAPAPAPHSPAPAAPPEGRSDANNFQL